MLKMTKDMLFRKLVTHSAFTNKKTHHHCHHSKKTLRSQIIAHAAVDGHMMWDVRAALRCSLSSALRGLCTNAGGGVILQTGSRAVSWLETGIDILGNLSGFLFLFL